MCPETQPAVPSPPDIPERYNLVSHFLDRHLEEGRGDKVAIISGAQQFCYRDVAELTNAVGNGLRSLGVEEEQRVLIVLPDSVEFVAAYLGAMKIGAVAVPTNTALRGPDYAYFLDESRAKVLLVHAALLPEVGPVLEARRYLKHVVVCGADQSQFLNWDQWVGEQSPDLEPADTDKDDVAFWLWTSGSTGIPKAAVHLQHDWAYCCEYYARGILDMGAQDTTFSSSKLFHAYGLGNGLLFPFYVGATTVLFPGPPKPDAILETAHATRPTLFFSVPTLYAAMLHATDETHSYDLASVRLAVSAAEPLPPEIYKQWKERFQMEILDGIGSTEVLHIYASPRPGQVKPGSTGQTVPGYETRITDENGNPIPQGEVGDLWVKGESSAPYYWHRHQFSKERMQGEWFLSGDKYYQDEDGYLWYSGRTDDMFRVSGQWVSPIEVENALIEHPAVLESAVVPEETEEKLTKPKAFVVLKTGRTADDALVEELQEFVRERITPYKYPRKIEFVDDLPKTAAGKIQRFKLRTN